MTYVAKWIISGEISIYILALVLSLARTANINIGNSYKVLANFGAPSLPTRIKDFRLKLRFKELLYLRENQYACKHSFAYDSSFNPFNNDVSK